MKTLILSMLLMASTFAQQGANTGGGGSFSEVDLASNQEELKQTISKIRKFFLKHPELSASFPEIPREKLIAVTENINVEVVSHVLTDRNGVEGRTCLNNDIENKIVCNNSELLKANNNARLLFVLMFHEILGLIGVEETSPKNALVIDGYSTSKKLAPYVTKVNNYDLVIEQNEEVKVPEILTTDDLSTARQTSLFSPFTKIGVKKATLRKARLKCLSQFEVCHVRAQTYKSECRVDERIGRYFLDSARICVGTVIWKGEKPRTNTKAFYVDSDADDQIGFDKGNFKKVLKEAFHLCRKAGYLLCTLEGHQQIKTKTGSWFADHRFGETEYDSTALVIGRWRVNKRKHKVVQSNVFECSEPKMILDYDLLACEQSGLKNCRVVAHKGNPSCKYLPSVVGDLP